MAESNAFSRWWNKFPTWRKIWNISCLLGVFLLSAAPVGSFFASVVNHNSINDYPRFYFYYPYLVFFLVPVYLFAAGYTFWKHFWPKEVDEDEEATEESPVLQQA
ncbi:MAG: hypothetical protein OK449_06995 [Thaumarchaeota archaeon]|nr:hypothetical protein [Nitrososphaerota archaeon]